MAETAVTENLKLTVLKKIGNGINLTKASGPSNYWVGHKKVHARFCQTNDRSPQLFKFNINPNTLEADYELWICGEVGLFYLLPISVMKSIYDDPNAYLDYHHPEIRVVSVDVAKDKVTYKTGGGKLDIAQYRNKTI